MTPGVGVSRYVAMIYPTYDEKVHDVYHTIKCMTLKGMGGACAL